MPVTGSGRIRIIAGRLRNSRLDVPTRPGLRPTPDRLRETLFNWLAPHITGARCLDLFAGTGALGIEALSRGAAEVVLVERDPALASAIVANLTRLRENASVVARSAADFLVGPARPFDLVFLDPPFELDLWQPTLKLLSGAGWLASNALMYMEYPADRPVAAGPGWGLLRETRVSTVGGSLYRLDSPLG